MSRGLYAVPLNWNSPVKFRTNPTIVLPIVVFPLPDSPTRAVIFPWYNSKLISDNTWSEACSFKKNLLFLGNVTERCCTDNMGELLFFNGMCKTGYSRPFSIPDLLRASALLFLSLRTCSIFQFSSFPSNSKACL